MAYREMRMVDIDQVMRRLAGEGIRSIGRATGLDRNTARRIVRLGENAGVQRETPWPDQGGKLQAIRERMGRPGAPAAPSQAEQQLKPRTDQIRTWLHKDHLQLTKVHELLVRDGLVVSYSALHRFARKCCDFGMASLITVRRAESLAGEMAEAVPAIPSFNSRTFTRTVDTTSIQSWRCWRTSGTSSNVLTPF